MAKPTISLLVPFRSDHDWRSRVWDWLAEYWVNELPDENVEIVIGNDPKSDSGYLPFSKSVAVNDAFHRSSGDVIVILDADTYMRGRVIEHAARRIRHARKHGVRMWFMPYRLIFRINKQTTERVLATNPKNPMRFNDPPEHKYVEDTSGSQGGHKYGALIQIMPREAFEEVGCMDPRFRGWGGEDVSFLRALDTLWCKHKNLPGSVLHLWHPKWTATDEGAKLEEVYNPKPWKTRVWAGQSQPEPNIWLSIQYFHATGVPAAMRVLVDAGCHRDDPFVPSPSPEDPPAPEPPGPSVWERVWGVVLVIGRVFQRAFRWLFGYY